MTNWLYSSAAGFVLTGQYRPICSIVHAAPDCMARRVAVRALDMAFAETGHCRRVALTYALGRALRG